MMFHVHDRAYDPEQIAVMGSALDGACGSLSSWANGNSDDVKETLARIILWHFDLGARDPLRLSNLALHTLASGRPPDDPATGGELDSSLEANAGQGHQARDEA
jgi:hypothetical protein